MKKLVWKGIVFDDYTLDEYGHYWAEVSEESVIDLKINRILLDEGAMGICSIEGHEEEADYYIDFPINEITME